MTISICQLKAATITISSGTTLTVGSFTVNVGDTLKVYGTLNVLNNFINNGMLINYGKINLTGSLNNNSTGLMFNADSILVGGDWMDNLVRESLTLASN